MRTRAATPADHASFARFFAELKIDDPVPEPAAWASEWMPDSFFVAEPVADGEVLAGYGMVRPMDGVGHVAHVVVAPAYRGRGIGMRVMAHAAATLRAAGCRDWYLAVKPDNAPAIRLYERCGMKRVHRSEAMAIAWKDVASLAQDASLVWRALDAGGSDDDRVTVALSLMPGQLANTRKRGYVNVAAFDGAGEVVGAAAFQPSFPGAFPFRVRAGIRGCARALLEGMRAFALPQHDYVRVVAENDAPLAGELHAAGAVTKLVFEQMGGAIPDVAALRIP